MVKDAITCFRCCVYFCLSNTLVPPKFVWKPEPEPFQSKGNTRDQTEIEQIAGKHSKKPNPAAQDGHDVGINEDNDCCCDITRFVNS